MRSLSSRTAVVAVVILFWVNGLGFGVYAAALPTFKTRFDLSPFMLAALFLLISASAITAMQVCGRLVDRIGARRVALAAIVPLIVAAVGFALVPSYPVLLCTGVLFGLSNGAIDVTMNAIGVQVEQRRGRPIMSFFHGMWAVGQLAGSGAVVVVAWATGWSGQAPITAVALGVAVAAVAALAVSVRITPQTAVVAHTSTGGAKTPIPKAAYLLGVMAIAFGVGEGTATDWSGIHLTQVADVAPTVGSTAVAVIAAGMTVVRLVGDVLIARFGRRGVVRVAGAFAAVGYAMAATVSSLPLLLVGWGLVGLGMGLIAPQVYAVAGHTAGGRGLAVVVTFGYAAFLVTPAMISGLMATIGIQHAMAVPAVLLLGLLVLARVLPRKDDDPLLSQRA